MKFKRFMALAMAGVMTFAMAGSAIAATTPDSDKVFNGGLEFTKKATAANNVSSIDSDVEFKLEDTAPFAIKDTEGEAKTYDKAGTLTFENDGKIVIAGSELRGSAGSFTAEKSIKEAIESSISKPGVYYAKLTETSTVATERDNYFGWTKVSDKVYYIAAFAATNENNGYDVKYVAYEGGTDGADINKKASALEFENTYNKKSGSDDEENPTPSLKLKKEVTHGEYVEASQEYIFKVTITLPDTAKIGDVKKCNATAEITTGTGTVASEGKITGEVTDYEVRLQKDAEVSFKNLPVGSTVSVTEDTTNLAGKNFKEAKFTGDSEGTGSVSNVVLDEDGVSLVCTNDFTNITPTGLAISVAPFVAMFAAIGAAIALYVAAKRRVR